MSRPRLRRRVLLGKGASAVIAVLAGCRSSQRVPLQRAGSRPRRSEGAGGVAEPRDAAPAPRDAAADAADADAVVPPPADAGREPDLPAPAASDAAVEDAAGALPDASSPAPGPGLVPDPFGVLDLPPGFAYRIVQRTGEPMSDGYRVPGRPDAMGCFEGAAGQIILMRNHEIFEGDADQSPYFPGQVAPAEAYDQAGTAGVTRVVLDADSLAIVSSNLVLAGTYWNCAGGLSPWGWLSCEETLSAGHGYVFLCPTDAARAAPAQRIAAYGRMRHEAAAVHPGSMIAYLTEDRDDGCFYRFVPDATERPFEGRLQALRIVDRPGFDVSALRPGERLAIDWLDFEAPLPEDDSLRFVAQVNGAARVARGEGLWLTARAAYFCATAGGAHGRGQVLRLGFEPDAVLELVAEADAESLDMPDSVCVSPHGELYVGEDGGGGNCICRIDLDGSVVPFARNVLSASEISGLCFSPDGRTLFANLQQDGITLAIRGPFERELAHRQAATGMRLPRALGGLQAGLAVLACALFVRGRRDRGDG